MDHNDGMDTNHPRGYWWKVEKGKKHEALWNATEYLDEVNASQRVSATHLLRLYSNRMVAGMSGTDFITGLDAGEKIKMNVVKSCIDAATAFIGSNRPKALYLPIAGDYALRKRAESQTKFVSGVFHGNQQYVQSLATFRDGGIYGSGWQNVYEEDGHIRIERVLDDEIVIDPNEALYGDPRTMYRVKDIDRDVLKELFPKNKQDIAASGKLRDDVSDRQGIANPVTVIEGWHLPSTPGADDGWHVIAVQAATLLEEKYDEPFFPIAKWNWNDAPLGYRGVGIAEELASIQIEINFIAQKIQRLMTLATSMVWTEKGSGVTELSNKDWAQREYRGKPPIFQTTASVSAEYFSHLDRLYQRAFEIVGISQLQAQAKKPAGLDSGEALRAYNDIGSKRFQHTGQRWEHYHVVEIAERILACARRAQKDGLKPVLAMGDRDVEKIDFSSVGLEKDQYLVRVQPASVLPDTPAGKLQTFRDMAQLGPEMAPYVYEMMDGIPDLDHIVRRMKAPMEVAEKMVSAILEDEAYEPPYPEMNLQLARDVGTRELLRAKIDGVPEERLSLLRRWLVDIDDIQALAEAPPPQAAPMAPGGPTPQNPLAGPQNLTQSVNVAAPQAPTSPYPL